MTPTHRRPLPGRLKAAGSPSRLAGRSCVVASLVALAAAAAAVVAPLPAAARMTMGGTARTALAGCDAPTPVRARNGEIFTNVSDCTVGNSGRVSTGWVRIEPSTQWVPSNLTTRGSGANGRKVSGAVVEGGKVYLLQRNLNSNGTGMRLGWSDDFEDSRPSWRWASWTMSDFGWGSFAQGSPDGYEYVYLRGSKSAYGSASRIDLARVPKGRLDQQSAWQVFDGTPGNPSWASWSNRNARKPILTDSGRLHRPHVSRINGCWTMAVTMPPRPGERGGSGLAVYTSRNPYGPWDRHYYQTGVNMGESAQFSPLFPGKIILTRGDRFEWRDYSLTGGC